MRLFELIKSDGSKVLLQNASPWREVISAVEDARWQEISEATIKVASRTKLDSLVTIGDVLIVYGAPYVLDDLPSYTYDGALYTYEFIFSSAAQLLNNVQYYDTATDLTYVAKSPIIHNDAQGFAQIIVNNMCRVFGAGKWVLGYCVSTDSKTITFSGTSCLNATAEICSSFSTYYTIDYTAGVFTLNIGKPFGACPITFCVGAQRGLYTLKRNNVTRNGIRNIITVLGGRENLPYDYGAIDGRLTLPLATYPGSEIRDDESVARIGPREGRLVYDDIFPTYTGVVTSIDAENPTKFVDSHINFEILNRGAGVTIMFKTGSLAGMEIEVSGYEEATKTFTLLTSTDANDITIPGTTPYLIEVGDTYVLKGIVAQESHIISAGARLVAQALQDVPGIFNPQVSYDLTLEPTGLKREEYIPALGQPLNVHDPESSAIKSIRLTAYRRDLLLTDYDIKDIEVSDVNVNIVNSNAQAAMNKINNTVDSFGIADVPAGPLKDLYTLLNTIAERLGTVDWKTLKEGGYKYDPSTGKMCHKWLDVESLAADQAYIDDLTVKFLETVGDAHGYKVVIENNVNEEGSGISRVILKNSDESRYASIEYTSLLSSPIFSVGRNDPAFNDFTQMHASGILTTRELSSDGVFSVLSMHGIEIFTGINGLSATMRAAFRWNEVDDCVDLYVNNLPRGLTGTVSRGYIYRSPDGVNNDILRYQS